MTSSSEQPQNCDHECVCERYKNSYFGVRRLPCNTKITGIVCDHDTRSRPHPAPAPDVILSHMPSPCSYLLIEGMNVRCLDSTPRSRVDCDHHVNWHCWDLSNQREIAIVRKAREDVLKPLKNFADAEFELGRHSMREVREKTKLGTWPEELNPDIHYGEGQGRALMAGYFGKKIESLRSHPQHSEQEERAG